jgi:hypothetical protein
MTHQETPSFGSDAVAKVFQSFPSEARQTALALRDLIFNVASETPQAGVIEEALRWGQPAYLTPSTKSGSTLRIGTIKSGEVALFAHCATTIISNYAQAFPNTDRIEGNRAVIFASADAIVPDRLRLLIRHGLTYHLTEN